MKRKTRILFCTLLTLLMIAGMMPFGQTIYADGDSGEHVSIAFINRNGDRCDTEEYKVVTAADTVWDGNVCAYYAVTGNVTLENLVTVKGTVILILCDDTELNAAHGLNVEKGNNASLEIVAGIDKQNGKLTAQGGVWQAGIGGGSNRDGGTIIISGGVINARGGDRGAGIGGGGRSSSTEVIIYGGDITANGGVASAGIGGGGAYTAGDSSGSGGKVSIYGGTVYARGYSLSAGIGGGGPVGGANNGGAGGNVNIYGGTVIGYTNHPDGHAIGAGMRNSSNDNGSLTVYNEAVVYSGRMESSAQPVSETNGTSDRVNACRNSFAKISPCINHSYTVFKDITETTHTPICGYCTYVGEPEAHSYGDNDTCACGARQYTVSVVNGTTDKTKAVYGDIITITADPPAEGMAFVEWRVSSGTISFSQPGSVRTTFMMPKSDVEVLPVYADILIPDIADQTYTGEAIAPCFSVSLNDVDAELIQDTHYEVTYDKNTDAGEATLTVTMKSPSEGSKTVTFQILPADIEVTTGSAEKDAYDKTPLTYGAGAKITGLVNGETATVTATGSQTDAGSSQNTYAIDWGTAKAGNYRIAKETLGTLTVKPKPVTVTAGDASKTYGEADPTLTATVTGLVGSDKISYTLSREAGENTGTYVITPSGDTTQGNYSVKFAKGTFTIKKAAPNLGLSIEGWTEGETAKTIELTGNAENGAVTYAYKPKNADDEAYDTTVPTSAGDYTVRATVAETANYLGGEATADFTISAAPTYAATVQSVTWQKGSGDTLDLTIKRSEDDNLTFGSFVGLEIDGRTAKEKYYTASEGSLKLSVKPEYLETLSVGDHTIKVSFRDGSATVKLTVKAASVQPAPKPASPKTGDESNPALLCSLMLLSAAAMIALPVYARKRKSGK